MMERILKRETLGWSVKCLEKDVAYLDTFGYTRKESIRRFLIIIRGQPLFDAVKDWRGFYRKGYRCVKTKISEGW